jgi:tetratricopeptide (TPR) repeat protein
MWKYARPTLRAALCVALGACAVCAPSTSLAGSPDTANLPALVSPAKKAQAKARFTKAKQLYKQGKYRAAIDELQEALELDPEGAELVYNLGVIHEKLTEVETAIIYYKKYIAMISDEPEKDRVKEIIHRLKGAKTEVAPAKSAEPAPSPTPSESADAPAPPAAKKGRLDGLVIGSAVLAGAGLVTGVVFGVLAMGDRIQGTPSTNDTTTYQDLESRRDRAKQEALIADIGFGVAAVGTVTALVLYFARDKKSDEAPPPKTEARVVPSFAVLPGGVFAGLGARF